MRRLVDSESDSESDELTEELGDLRRLRFEAFTRFIWLVIACAITFAERHSQSAVVWSLRLPLHPLKVHGLDTPPPPLETLERPADEPRSFSKAALAD